VNLILISSCLLGCPVRYDGRSAPCDDPILLAWHQEGRLVPLCPEEEGGLPTPRPPAEIEGARGGPAVIQGRARVLDAARQDHTPAFLTGAQRTLALCRALGISIAVLKDGSPSCGSALLHDGSFTGRKVPGEGATTALLRAEGIQVFSENQLEEASAALAHLPLLPPI